MEKAACGLHINEGCTAFRFEEERWFELRRRVREQLRRKPSLQFYGGLS